jgi:hypothetical protein
MRSLPFTTGIRQTLGLVQAHSGDFAWRGYLCFLLAALGAAVNQPTREGRFS